MNSNSVTMVDFYRAQHFNPVFIPVEDHAIWEDHLLKRRNLYERHLGLPLSFLEGKRVLEFGCNSGENSLVLAASGARLILVEPHVQVLPRLRELYDRMGLSSRIEAIHETDIQHFESQDTFDLVLAEGFLSTLKDRDAMLEKLLSLVRPMGFCVFSFNDRTGGLLEILKRAVLHRTYRLLGIEDTLSKKALEVAQKFFLEDYQKLRASRSFETWWKDTLVVPVYTHRELWSCPEILKILDACGGLLYSTSPKWSTWEHFRWYKNPSQWPQLNHAFLEEWPHHFAYFITGIPGPRRIGPCRELAIRATENLVVELSGLSDPEPCTMPSKENSQALLADLKENPQDRIFAMELERILEALVGENPEVLYRTYLKAQVLRSAWGCPYQYFAIQKNHCIPTGKP